MTNEKQEQEETYKPFKISPKRAAIITGLTGLIIGLVFTIGLLSGLLIGTTMAAPAEGLQLEDPAIQDQAAGTEAQQQEDSGAETESVETDLEELEEVPYDVEFGRGEGTVEWNDGTVNIDERPRMGSSDAEVTMVSYEDFFCPFCGSFHNEDIAQQAGAVSAFPEIVEQHIETGEVQYYFQQMPVVGGDRPAEVSECFAEHGNSEDFWTFQYNHFANIEDMQELQQTDSNQYDEVVLSWAEQMNIDREQIQSCMDSGEMQEEVSSQSQEGQSLGAQGTPAIFVEGELIEGAREYEIFEAVINDKL